MGKKIIAFILIVLFLATPAEASAKTYTSKKDVYTGIKKNLVAHKEEFTIVMDSEVMNEIGTNTDLFSKVAALDDKSTSKDGDYLKFSVSRWRANWRWNSIGGTARLTFMAEYKTTLEQEKKVDAKIKSILKSLKLEDKSDYEKVKKIHDYVIKKTSYDQTYQNHSAYNALIDNTAVCEGYTLAAYRLFTDAGLKSRIITGRAGGEAHSWNIVKVGGKWYNIDLTWDDPITNTGEQVLRYDYFLKNQKDFSDHARDIEYVTKAFTKAYPIAANSYKKE